MVRKRRRPSPTTTPATGSPAEAYTVGYGKPPRHSQFKPGRSGNPKGRRRSSKNFVTLIEEELSTKVAVTEGGRRRALQKRKVIVKRLVNKAAEGDHRATQILVKYLESANVVADATRDTDNVRTLDPGDDAILEAFEKSILERASGDNNTSQKLTGPSPKGNEENGK